MKNTIRNLFFQPDLTLSLFFLCVYIQVLSLLNCSRIMFSGYSEPSVNPGAEKEWTYNYYTSIFLKINFAFVFWKFLEVVCVIFQNPFRMVKNTWITAGTKSPWSLSQIHNILITTRKNPLLFLKKLSS